MAERSRLVKMRIENIGCIGPEGLEINMDNIIVLVGENNSGKSTVLKAYELALGKEIFTQDDFCKRATENDIPKVELYIHIPKNTPNISDDWKFVENGLLLVKSKWEWDINCKRTRTTWDNANNCYSEDGKASGLDPVFNSRLPIPYRIGTLEDPKREHEKLLTLILQPFKNKIDSILQDNDSELSKSINNISKFVNIPINEEKQNLSKIKTDLNSSHQQIFPNLSLDFDINLGNIEIDILKYLKDNSRIKFSEFGDVINWDKQGTGSQRALFWSILQIRSQMQTMNDIIDKHKKGILDIDKEIKKLQVDADKAKTEKTKIEKQNKIEELKQNKIDLEKIDISNLSIDKENEISLPGYMLLIDEPEVALHPNAIRAASKQLYNLANDPSWQVMITTHSPLFVDPLQDHTTIIRLDRNDNNPSPKTYISDKIRFSPEEIDNLKMLNRYDQSLAEMFFGQHPILIEGDTEFTAFDYIMNTLPYKYPNSKRPALIRARGKFILDHIIKMLIHFKLSFSIIHDADSPKNKAGNNNGVWSENIKIYNSIKEGRDIGLKIIHRLSFPDFENSILEPVFDDEDYLITTSSKEKPWKIYKEIQENSLTFNNIEKILDELIDFNSNEEPFEEPFDISINKQLEKFISTYNVKDKRFNFE
jgi:putative ATP-dependent endonuclease of the OLD family